MNICNKDDNKIVNVAIPPFRHPFDYLFPEDSTIKPQVGLRVKVPFGNTKRIGIIVGVGSDPQYDPKKLKIIENVLDEEPLFNQALLKLIQFVSQYYHTPLGDLFFRSLPPWLRKDKALGSLKNKDKTSVPFQDKKIAPSVLTNTVIKLNEEQQKAKDEICRNLSQFQAYLLDGVTGSGKTEVYLAVVEQILQQNKQALILVPEIGLTPQMVHRFQKYFQTPIALLHSGISEKKRFEAWSLAKNGEAPIVIGTRSALFTPLKSPGIFIIDEEHDPSFKQQDNFRYHARDLLVFRASLENCPIVLGSATPSLETLHNTTNSRYQHLRLTKRATLGSLPKVQIIDIRHKKTEEGLSSELLQAIKRNLENEGQTLLFLNRRGFAPVMMCFACGHVAHCKNCDIPLVLHYYPKKLRCHHCELSTAVYEQCPCCKEGHLNPIGIGTERLENTLLKHFQKDIILRLDRDNMRKKDSFHEALERIKNFDAKILLGTQMIAKGHDFSKVTLVGILEFDQALYSTDFRSLERLGQVLTQVSGRAGRRENAGIAMLQTAHPKHPLLNSLLEHGYHYFAEQLLSERKRANLPPFSYQALIRTHSKKLSDGINFLDYLKRHIKSHDGELKILGPVSAPIERKQDQFHAQLLLQADERSRLQKNLKKLVNGAEDYKYKSKIRWSLDVDPIEMF